MYSEQDQELKLLLLEDSATDADLLLRELQKAGVRFSATRVFTHEDYLYNLIGDTPSMILADYTIPGFDVLEALDICHNRFPEIPFIFISGTMGEERAIEAIKRGATDYILKDNIKLLPLAIVKAKNEAREKIACKKAEDELREYQENLEVIVNERTEKQLIASRKYSAILATTQNGFCLIDFKGRLIEVNEAYSKMSGFSQDELLTMKIQDLEASESEDQVLYHIHYVQQAGHHEYETRLRRKDGIILDVEISASRLDIDEGRIVLFIWDVTDRRRIEKYLRESESRFRSLADNSPDIIQRFDTELQFIYVNPAGLQLYHMPLDAFIGRTVSEISTPANLTSLWNEKMRDVLLNGKPVKIEYLFPTQHKQRYYQTLISPEFDNANNVVSLLAVTRDITELKLAEKIKDDFIGMVSHELRTPLTVLIGAIKVAMSGGLSPAEVQSLLQDADFEADYLASLLGNLLELSRMQAGRFSLSKTRTDINTFLTTLIAERQNQFPSYKFSLDLQKSLPLVEFDPIRLSLILKNLINNSVKYSPKGTLICIIALRDGDYVQIGVKDQGKGIAKEEQPKLFQSFERLSETSTSTPGLGLGLLVCQRLVQVHSGKIWVDSEQDKGSTFWFTLPITPAK